MFIGSQCYHDCKSELNQILFTSEVFNGNLKTSSNISYVNKLFDFIFLGRNVARDESINAGSNQQM